MPHGLAYTSKKIMPQSPFVCQLLLSVGSCLADTQIIFEDHLIRLITADLTDDTTNCSTTLRSKSGKSCEKGRGRAL
jgi:hypothetical protein